MKNLVLEIIPVLINFAGKNAKWIAFLLLVSGFFSCGSAVCENTNPVFDNYEPVSKEYQLELIKQLSIVDKSKLTYWFKEYTGNENKEQLHFHIQSKELCAVLVLDMERWNKLEHFRKVKGGGYRGAEFVHLQFDIEQDSLNPKFVYRNLSRIID